MCIAWTVTNISAYGELWPLSISKLVCCNFDKRVDRKAVWEVIRKIAPLKICGNSEEKICIVIYFWYKTLCAILYHLYNFKNVKNTYTGVLILVKLTAKVKFLLPKLAAKFFLIYCLKGTWRIGGCSKSLQIGCKRRFKKCL